MSGEAALEEELAEALAGLCSDPDSIDPQFNTGVYCCPEHSPDTFSVILIACVNSRFLVAFPSEAWAREIQERKLAAQTLEKPVQVRVAVASPEFGRSFCHSVDWLAEIWAGTIH